MIPIPDHPGPSNKAWMPKYMRDDVYMITFFKKGPHFDENSRPGESDPYMLVKLQKITELDQ